MGEETKEPKKGFMVLTPVGAFKSPCSGECAVLSVEDNIARMAAGTLSPNMKGLQFIASVHEAHYKACEDCQKANPTPDPKPNAEDVAEIQAFKAQLDQTMETGLESILGALGISREEALAEIAKVIGDESPTKRRSIGFGAGADEMVN